MAVSRPEKTVLMVVGDFPPHGIVGVLRSLKFCKYLPDYGWCPTILASRVRRGYDYVDESLLLDVPDSLREIRTPFIDPRYLRAKLTTLLKRSENASANAGAPESAGNGSKRYRIFRKLWYFLLHTPEDRAGWFPFAVWKGFRPAIGCDCIYSSGPPHTCHVVALALHLLTGKPFVMDYRDPWGFNPWLARPTRFHRPMHQITERLVLRHAARVIASTEEIRQGILDLYPGVNPGKVRTITNGFDGENIEKAFSEAAPRNQSADSRFLLRYFGNLYSSRNPSALFEAIRKLSSTGIICEENFRLELVGRPGVSTQRMIREHGVEGLVVERERVPYEQALRMMRESTALVIIGSEETDHFCVATKTYEYLASRRPILGLVPPGPIQRLIEEEEFGQTARPQEADRIADILQSMIRKHQTEGTPDLVATNLHRYHRRALTGHLAEVLNEVLR